ncbi:MAG: hypothetical protein R6X27_18325 [Candidatus Desulfacyla sp.]
MTYGFQDNAITIQFRQVAISLVVVFTLVRIIRGRLFREHPFDLFQTCLGPFALGDVSRNTMYPNGFSMFIPNKGQGGLHTPKRPILMVVVNLKVSISFGISFPVELYFLGQPFCCHL